MATNVVDFVKAGFKLVYVGFVKVWRSKAGFEIVQPTDAISLLVYVKDKKLIVFVEQERLPMMGTVNVDSFGHTLELIAGRLDKPGVSFVDIARAEAKEEAGVTVEKVHLMNEGKPLALSPGVSTERCYIAYAVVDSSQLEGSTRYGSEDGEQTIRTLIPIGRLPRSFDSAVTMASVVTFLRMLERGEIDEAKG